MSILVVPSVHGTDKGVNPNLNLKRQGKQKPLIN